MSPGSLVCKIGIIIVSPPPRVVMNEIMFVRGLALDLSIIRRWTF